MRKKARAPIGLGSPKEAKNEVQASYLCLADDNLESYKIVKD